MGNVFISYSASDLEFAELVRLQLEKRGLRTWLDQSALIGDDWKCPVGPEIRSRDVLVLIVSPASSGSAYITYEWAYALGRGAKVVPVLFKPATMHRRLESLECLDFSDLNNRDWESLARAVSRLRH
jgi:hypothetical protein